MSLSVWDLPVAVRPEFDEYEPEPAPCASVYFGHATAGVLSCVSTVPGHADLPGDGRCGAPVGPELFRWSTAMAAESRAQLVEAFGGWECLNCGRPCYRQGRRGCCSAACELAEHRVDDRDDAEVEG